MTTNSYFSIVREDLIAMIEPGTNRILDIGCGTGATGQMLKRVEKATEVIGIELVSKVVNEADKNLDKVINADIEILELPFPQEYFDYIICADVLEHLRDPWSVLRKIRKKKKKEGYIIASIPNVRNWIILKELIIKGKWTYVDEGILDNTHLRFFTRNSIKELFLSTNFDITEIKGSRAKWSYKLKLANTLTLGLLKNFLIGQYIVKAQRAN